MSKLIQFETRAEFENYITSNSGLPFEEALSASNNGVYGSVVLIKDTGEIYANNKLQEPGPLNPGAQPDYATRAELDTKQDKIEDLPVIRAGASKGATALQTHQDISGKLDKTEASSTYATKTEVSNKVNGDGNITNVVKVSALPDNPDANTLYVIVE